jgi:hypothetical protein
VRAIQRHPLTDDCRSSNDDAQTGIAVSAITLKFLKQLLSLGLGEVGMHPSGTVAEFRAKLVHGLAKASTRQYGRRRHSHTQTRDRCMQCPK